MARKWVCLGRNTAIAAGVLAAIFSLTAYAAPVTYLKIVSGPGKKSQVALKRLRTDGICNSVLRVVGESPYQYAARLAGKGDENYPGLDIDCIINQYSEGELRSYAQANDYTAIFAVNAAMIIAETDAYCLGSLQLYGNESINFKYGIQYKDYLHEYFLFLARVKKYSCSDRFAAYKYYEAAEEAGASVNPLEKGA